MRKKKLPIRLLSLLLAVVLVLGCCPTVKAADSGSLDFTRLESSDVSMSTIEEPVSEEAAAYQDTDLVRVSIVLNKQSTLERFGSAEAAEAQAYRQALRQEQADVTAQISRAIGSELDVVWNLTLAANIISANVTYGEIEEIESLDSVAQVVIETQYSPDVVSTGEADPDMTTATQMTGASAAWASGYTGAGSRIAVIDTGIDTDHQSFSSQGFAYSLAYNAGKAGMDVESYRQSLDLLDAEEIAQVLDQLNIAPVVAGKNYTADDLYISEKLPFGFNYVDSDLDITHDNDSQSEHGSHVAGIAAANAYIPQADGSFANALETVKTQGVAPDAQIITLKVFGKEGGAYDSDYMAAIEDAIVLGCDVVNLSLGSGSPGYSRCANDVYQAILEGLTASGIVATMSAGNSGSWMENSYTPTGYLYADDVSMTTTGLPGTYENAFSVASVDNIGRTDLYLKAGDHIVFYSETTYSNEPIASLAGEQNYIYIDGFGTAEEFAALGDALVGKIAVCSRGELSFYQKGDNAVAAGAIGTIVYNNAEGTINMDLTDYGATAPFISITQADGAALKENAQPVTDEAGNVLYYEGTLYISDSVGVVESDSSWYTMSSFSSWGVPGSLSIKPEITAPGGNIYSVNGLVAGGESYETMSGTSMAAPQVAGMTALLAQYIRQSGLDETTGRSARFLAQSLLMSTAEPVMEEASGSYYSVLKQGSGLANVANALASQSYIVMGEDGKVKAELGDDPDRTGVYTFDFTLCNLAEETQRFYLSGDFFTQDWFTEEGISYLNTTTTPLGAEIAYTVNGAAFIPAEPIACDLDGDGDTDGDDAQVILNYTAGLLAEIDPMADVDQDGSVTTYDAQQLLQTIYGGTVSLEAGESAVITVTVTLPEQVRQYLDASYLNGAYVEGYVYATPASTVEGLAAPAHSIPVLGFYGNWSDASMFDRITYTGSLYGDTTVPYLGYDKTNNLIIKHKGDSNGYFQIGNPYQLDETYDSQRTAIRSSDTLYQYRISLIRNAAAITVAITDDSGETLYLGSVANQAGSAYYSTSSQTWKDTLASYTMNRKVSSVGLLEGQQFTVSVIAIPEYYETDGLMTGEDVEALLASGTLGEGAFLRTTLTVDDTAPELVSVEKDLVTGNLTVTGLDNQYIAQVQVRNVAGTQILASGAAVQENAGETAVAKLDLTDVKVGPQCMIILGDYAGNETSYIVDYGGEPEDYSSKMYGFTSSKYRAGNGSRFMEIDPELVCYQSESEFDGTVNQESMDINVTAAEYVDGYVFMAADDGSFYVAPQGQWNSYRPVGQISEGLTIMDMAWNTQDKTLYVLDQNNTVYAMDLVTGDLEQRFTVTITNPATKTATYLKLMNLAIDDEGNFYSTNSSSNASRTFLYKWSLADVVEGAITDLAPMINDKTASADFVNSKNSALAWDHDQDILYWANASSANSQSNNLTYFDLETGKAVKTNPDYYLGKYPAAASRLYVQTTGLYIVPSSSSSVETTDEATNITLDCSQQTLLVGAELTLTAQVYPWTLDDQSVTWSSSDPTVATVENGIVTAVGVGQAVITATTSAQPHLTASCTITVEKLENTSFSGLVYDADGNTHWAEFPVDAPETWTAVADGAGYYFGGAMLNEVIYVHDGETLYAVDPDTFETRELGGISETWIWSDAAPAPAQEGGLFDRLIILCDGGTKVAMLEPEEGTLTYWSLSSYYSSDPLAAIAYVGDGMYTDKYPSANYYVLTESGALWLFEVYTKDDGKSYTLARTEIGSTGIDLSGVSDITGNCYASMLYDAQSGYLVLSSYVEGNSATLQAIDPVSCIPAPLGEFGENIWPVVSLYQYTRVTELTVKLKPAYASLYEKDTLQLNGRVLPAAYEDGLIWATSDPEIATVDENGLVTAHKEGTVTITATSVATNDQGQPASAQTVITVVPLLNVSATVAAQITDETGTHWVSIQTNDTSNVTVLADTNVQLAAGGYHDGKIYGIDGDYTDTCNIYMIDPADGFKTYLGQECSTSYSFMDLTAAPAMDLTGKDKDGNEITVTAFGSPLFISQSRSIVYLTDYENGTVLVPSFDIARKYPDVAAVAYLGSTLYRDKYPAEDYIILCADGSLVMLEIYALYVTSESRVGYTLRQKALGNVGMKFQDDTGLSMTYLNDGTNEGLVVAYSEGSAELYYIDLKAETLTIGKLGNVGTATAIAAPYVTTIPGENTYPYDLYEGSEEVCSSPVFCWQSGGVELPLTESTVETTEETTKNPETGSLQSTRTVTPLDEPTGPVTAANGLVSLNLKQSVDTANALMEITYDPEALTFTGLTTSLSWTAYDAQPGKIVFAFANPSAVPAGFSLAQLTFTYEGEFVDTAIQVKTTQRSEAVQLSETAELAILQEDGGHHYELTDTQAPNCDQEGHNTYTCTKCGHSYTEAIPAHCASAAFQDLNTSAWYHPYTDYVLDHGIMVGMEDNLFIPNGSMTRGMLVTTLYRLAGAPDISQAATFTDLRENAYYTDAVAWAQETGIARGLTDTTFGPEETVTRQQAAVFLYRYVTLYLGQEAPAAGDLSGYSDSGSIQPYAKTAMAWATAQGLFEGFTDGTLRPTEYLTRAQLAKLLTILDKNF